MTKHQQQADGELHEDQLLNFLVKPVDEEVCLSLANNAEFDTEDIYEVLVGAAASFGGIDAADVLQLGTCLPHPARGSEAPVDAGDVTKDGLEAWKNSGRGPGLFPQTVQWSDEAGATQRADSNELIQAAKTDRVPEGVRKLAQRTFADLDVVDVIIEVKRMMDAGAAWSAEEIQMAVEEVQSITSRTL